MPPTPTPEGICLDALMHKLATPHSGSRVRSLYCRWTPRSKRHGKGEQYSAERNRPKKAEKIAARSMTASRAGKWPRMYACRRIGVVTVTGRLGGHVKRTRHPRREAETEAEMLQPCQVCAEGGHGKARLPEGHKQLQHKLLEGERVGDPHLPTKPGTDAALTCKFASSRRRSVKATPNVRRNHRRYEQCPACYGPELIHLQTRKHISVNILAARHVRQKQIYVLLGKEKEKPGTYTCPSSKPAPPACCPCKADVVRQGRDCHR